jgi:hypothetical protein
MAHEPAETDELIAILRRGHEAKDLDNKAAAAWVRERQERVLCAGERHPRDGEYARGIHRHWRVRNANRAVF